MRLADCFIDIFIYIQDIKQKLKGNELGYDEVREKLEKLLSKSERCSDEAGFSTSNYQDAKYPIIAFIDEAILCSQWSGKSEWQKNSFQRIHYNTTNIGSEFYEKLGQLSKQGSDVAIREVYALCLGMGFKGKYFSTEDQQKLENIKEFNLSCLLPEKSQRNLDTATLFPTAYAGHEREDRGSYKPRFNIFPFVIGFPVIVLITVSIIYHSMIVEALDIIHSAIQ